MLFNSLRFLFFFLPVTMLGFHLLGRYGRRPVIAWLAFMSVVFYAAWNPAFVLFLLGSILVNFLVAANLAAAPEDSPHRKRLLAAGIDSTVIALWLGHESIHTTQVYLHADLTTKEHALNRTTPTGATPGRYHPEDDTLLTFLQTL